MKTKDVVTLFFEALKNKDYDTLSNLYAPNALFNDDIYENLNGFQAAKMWEMFLKNSQNLTVAYEVTRSFRKKAKAKWILNYKDKKTGKQVNKAIKSEFEVDSDKIYTQNDKFDMSKVVRQNMGLLPWMIGFTGIPKKKIQEAAEKELNEYIIRNP